MKQRRWVESFAKLRTKSKFQQLLQSSLSLPKGVQKSGNCCNLISLATFDPAVLRVFFVFPYLNTCIMDHKPSIMEPIVRMGRFYRKLSVSVSNKSFPEFLPPGIHCNPSHFSNKAHKPFYWKCE